MPILSTFGAASFAGIHSASGGAQGSGLLYFYPAANNLWSNLANWFKNSSHSVPADALPDTTNSVTILGDCTIEVNNSFVYPSTISVTGNGVDANSDGLDDGFVLTLHSNTSATWTSASCAITGDGQTFLDGVTIS
jgi:hypothetical protein